LKNYDFSSTSRHAWTFYRRHIKDIPKIKFSCVTQRLDKNKIFQGGPKTLEKRLGLPTEEKRALIYTVITPKIHEIDKITNELEDIGIEFFHQDTDTIFIPDEIAYELQELLKIDQPFPE
jgi:hypothetical protein